MKTQKTILMLAASLSLVSQVAWSQADLDGEIDAELSRIYAEQDKSSDVQAVNGRASQVQVNVNASPAAVNSTESGMATSQVAPQAVTAPAVAAPQQMVAPVAIQQEPVTYIESTPLTESRAEMIRKSRQDAEVKTEQKIVEKLEMSRLEDEKRRSDVLFGDKWQQMNNTNTQQVIVPAQPVVVQEQQIAPVQVVAEPVDQDPIDEEIIRNEVRASLAEMHAQKPVEKKSYFSGGVGLAEYMDVSNVRNNYSLGFAVGSKVNDRLLVEGSFMYGNFEIDQRDGYSYCDGWGCGYYNRITDMDQYSGAATAKYQLFSGVFRPVFGGTLAYTYRTFSDDQFGLANNDAQSHALDLGAVAGADLELAEDFSVGIEFKHMFWNIMNRNSNRFSRGFSQTVYGNDTPIERLNQTTISVFGRATF